MTAEQRRASAAVSLTLLQMILLAAIVIGFFADGMLEGSRNVVVLIAALVTAFYLAFTGFKHLCWVASYFHTYPDYELINLDDPTLPKVSVVVAARDEVASIANLVTAIQRLKYPKNLLEILLLMDEDDLSTIEAARRLNLPEHIKVCVVPDAGPNLKPKALIYGYPRTSGKIVVPYDVEDRMPDDQIMHAVSTFRARPVDRRGRKIGCVQGRLTFWNPRGSTGKSWVSSMVYAEYAVHYLRMLPGMDRLGLVFPFGGTTCFFLREALDDVAFTNGFWQFPHRRTGEMVEFQGPWDLNPTEDADIAWRMARCGWRGAVFDSSTNEEAPEKWDKARRQGGRWLHGYGLTALVSMRQPFKSMKQVGVPSWFAFNLFMLGTLVSLFINPITWAVTALYFVSRIENWYEISSYVHSLYQGPVYYFALLAMFANLSLYFQKILTVVEAQELGEKTVTTESDPRTRHMQAEQYGITARVAFATPLWWAWRSMSAWRASRLLLNKKHNQSWSAAKSEHGAAVGLEAELERASG